MSLFLLILGLVLFVALVVIHEFGHFLAARRNGVDVEEFGIGFPPKLWGKKLNNGVLFTINWLPFGGFVRLKGEHDADTAKGSFGAASLRTKVKVMLAGVGMNLLGAFVLFTIVAWLGTPTLIPNQFTVASDEHIARQHVVAASVTGNSPAEKAGIRPSDKIVSITDEAGKTTTIRDSQQLVHITKQFQGQHVGITIDRDGAQKKLQTTLLTTEQTDHGNHGYLGVGPADFQLKRYTWSAPIVAVGMMGQFTAATFQGLGSALAAIFQGNGAKASAQVSGPLGIFVLLKNGSLLGIEFILAIIGLISLTLAIMNVLPIPALDGGRLFMTLIARGIFKKPLSEDLEEKINGYGFLALIGLIILITITDVKRYF
jgi:regulator of sigma E protease